MKTSMLSVFHITTYIYSHQRQLDDVYLGKGINDKIETIIKRIINAHYALK